MSYDSTRLDELKHILFSLVPNDGNRIGNLTLRQEFLAKVKADLGLDLSEDDYWLIRQPLLDEKKIETGRGRSGSVRRLLHVITPTTCTSSSASETYEQEVQLYEPFHETIQKSYVRVYNHKFFVSQITASAGRRPTGGKWTRPDVALAVVKTYQHIPGKSLELVTFEIKPAGAFGIEGVFETASHSSYAHRSYLALYTPKGAPLTDHDNRERLERECTRFGVGLWTFEDPKDWDTFDILVEPTFHPPDPGSTDDFIFGQLSKENKDKLMAWIK
jgi:hypothetical protein